MTFGQRTVMFIATGGFVGYFPIAPGTMGSLVGLLFCLVFALLPLVWVWVGLFLLVGLAVWSAHLAAGYAGKKDPGWIVIDEIAGMTIALAGINLSLATAGAGFLLFRVFDVFKPFPVGWLDRRLSGGWGIVLDDIAAGLMTNAVLRFGLYLVKG